jgi:eukaryotic-like serine/threonine-protein kinase
MITHDSWQRIKEIFQSAQDLRPEQRSVYLDKVCGDDKSIREEVEALLTADEGNDDFLSAPAYEFAAGMLAGEGTEFIPGEKMGRYLILCSLGYGGMGQIYLAQDSQLGRKIALKLISPEFASDARRVHRFKQEARAISALNHPNICIVHETGVTEHNRHFIAMEYIQGSTVRERLSRGGGFSVVEAVDVALQVADALASAHAAGIVHRDIKPENIMLRPDGYVKVLDFGLAKLVHLLPEQQRHADSSNMLTDTGTLMGTVKYMSPEQLRDVSVDERTDIWSLGVVLYEMLTNSTPFEASTSNDTVALILSGQAPPLRFPSEIPKRLQEVVKRALEKNRADRYQTVTKLAAELHSVQRELHKMAEDDSKLIYRRFRVAQPTQELTGASALFSRLKSQAMSKAETLIGEIRSHTAVAVFGATAVLLLLFFLPGLIRHTPTNGVQQLTTTGTTVISAVSSDGKFFAHAERNQGRQGLLLSSVATSTDFEVAPMETVEYLGLSFSPDNNYLYFTRREKTQVAGTPEKPKEVLYRVPVMSNSRVRILEDVHSPITFSPAGDRFAFVRLNPAQREYSLMLADVSGANEQPLATRKNGDTLSVSGAAWSPDGTMVVCAAGAWKDGFKMKLIGFDVQTKTEQALGDKLWFSILQAAWQNDMSAIIVSARERETTPHQLWRITYPAGAVERITTDLAEYEGVSLAGDKVVTVKTIRSWGIWLTTFGHSLRSSKIASGTGFIHGLTWTPEGRIVFTSMVNERLNLFRINPDGSNRFQLTSKAGDNYNPAASTDGRFLVFSSNRGGKFNIWRINADDGGGAKALTLTDGNFYPSVSSDNQWVAYDKQTDLTLSIWKVPLEGGESIKLIEGYRMPAFSPDNQFIAGRYDRESGTADVAIFPAAGGEPTIQFKIPIVDWQRLKWIDSRAFSFIDDTKGPSNIWSYDLNTGTSKQLTNFDSEQIYAYDWSTDFKQLVSQRGHKISDVMMINYQPHAATLQQ